MLAAVPLNAALCRLVRGYSVGANAATPDLWGFCGARQPAPPRLTSHPACSEDGARPTLASSVAIKGATQMVTSDRNSYPGPKPALEHADRMLRETGPEAAGLWSRAAARLIRLAPKRAADLHWSRTRPEMIDCPATMRIPMLEGVPGRARARRAFPAWSRLSDATHPYPYELAPTAGELRRWHSEVTSLVGLLDVIHPPAIQLIQQTMMGACSECARGTTGKRDQPSVLPLASRPRVPSCPDEADRGSRPCERAHRHATKGPLTGHLQHRGPVLVTKSGGCRARTPDTTHPPVTGAGRRPGAGRALFTVGRGTTMSFRSRAAPGRALES